MRRAEIPAVAYTSLTQSLLFVDVIRPFGLGYTPVKLIITETQLLSVFDHNLIGFQRQLIAVLTTGMQPVVNYRGAAGLVGVDQIGWSAVFKNFICEPLFQAIKSL